MKCKIANNISSHKFSLSLLFLVVISVNFSSAFANNLQKNKIEKKFSSFLSANDTSENMDALDDLSMFADMDNLDELEKVAENLKSKISGEKGEGEKGKTNGKEEKVFFEKKKENLEKDVKKIDDKNVEEDERIVLKDFTSSIKKSKNEQKVMEENKINNSSKPQEQNKKADNANVNVNNSKTNPSSSAPKSKKYAIIKSKPDYKKMYSKSKSESKSNFNLNSNAKTKSIVNNIKKNPNQSVNAAKKEEKKLVNKISEKKVSNNNNNNNNKSQSDDSSNKKKSSPLKIKINPPVSVSASLKKIEEKGNNKQKETQIVDNKSLVKDSQFDTTTISTNKQNTNWISILDKTIKKNENKNKKENTNPSFSNQDSGIENITEDFESDSSSSLKNKFIKPVNNHNHNNIHKNIHKNTEVSLPKEEDKKLFSELDPNFVKNLLKMQNDPNIKKLLTSSGVANLKNQNEENISKNSPSFSIRKISHENNENSENSLNSLNEPNFMQLSDSNIQFDAPSQDNSFIHSMPMPMPRQSQQSFNPMRFIQKSKEKINKSQIRNYYKPEELDMSKLVYINDLINKVRS
jgi:hypothetical protein